MDANVTNRKMDFDAVQRSSLSVFTALKIDQVAHLNFRGASVVLSTGSPPVFQIIRYCCAERTWAAQYRCG